MEPDKNSRRYARIVPLKKSCPVIVVDCSEWGQLLKIKVTPSAPLTVESQAAIATALLSAVDETDQANQGTGFRFLDARGQDTDVVIRLAPIDPHHAKERIAAIGAGLTQNVKPIPGIARLQLCTP